MKYFIVIVMSLMLAGCGKALTRLLPKVEKIDLPEELMVPPKDLKIINKPDPETIKKMIEQQKQKEQADVTPE